MRCKFISIAFLFSTLSYADTATIHRMYVFGSEKIYASHLSMLSMPVHQYQVLWEVDFGDDVNAKYRKALEERALHPLGSDSQPDDNENVFTLNPVGSFVLPDVIKSSEESAGTDHPMTISADLYSVHFERKDNTEDFKIASRVNVKLKRVVYKSPGRYDPRAIRPDHLTYQLFGTAKEAFLTHVISSFPKPNSNLEKDQGNEFDHFIPVTVADENLKTSLNANKTLKVVVPSLSKNEKLKDEIQISVQVEGMAAETTLSTGKTIYHETGDFL